MNDAADRIHQFLEAVSHASRFRLVLALCERERHVSELAVEVGLSQSCTTRHLQALERAHVIHTRRSGKRVMAALALEQPRVADLVTWLRGAGAPGGYVAAAANAESRNHASPRMKAQRPARPTRPEPAAPSNGAPPPRPADLDDFLL
jgi:DNA-binding transcriptional ArsR family regulator